MSPEVTYTVAECGEFHGMGRYRDDIKDVQEAIALWKEFQDSPLNGIPSIGILVHTPGQTDLDDEQLRSVIRTKDRSGYDAVLSGDLQRRGCH